MKEIVILGAGGFAREVQWLIEDNNYGLPTNERWKILGFVEPYVDGERIVNDLPVLTEDWLYQQKGIHVVCGLGEAKIRKRAITNLKARNPSLRYPSLVSRRAHVTGRVKMGEGCVICSGTICTCNAEIGDFVIVNLLCTVAHDVRVGSFTQINPSVNVSGGVIIGQEVQMGTGVKIIPNVRIGDGAVLGAGAVVIKDIPAGCTAVGCPARIVKEPEQMEQGQGGGNPMSAE